MIRIHAKIHTQNAQHAANHQPRCDDQHDGKRHFGDQQRGAKPLACPVGSNARTGFLERIPQILAGCEERGGKAEKNACSDGNCKSEQKNAKINLRICQPRDIVRSETQQRADRPIGKQEPGGSSQDRKENALGQQLLDQAPASRAESRADCKFLLPLRRPGEEQIRHVRAGYQKNESYGAQQNKQSEPRVAEQVVVER